MSSILHLILPFFLLFSSFETTALTPPSEEGKTVLLLAHRWESKALVLDLKLDGTFEGRLPSGLEVYGLWEMKSDRKTLVLQNDPLDEEEFQQQYGVVDVSFDKLRLKGADGRTMTLYLAE